MMALELECHQLLNVCVQAGIVQKTKEASCMVSTLWLPWYYVVVAMKLHAVEPGFLVQLLHYQHCVGYIEQQNANGVGNVRDQYICIYMAVQNR